MNHPVSPLTLPKTNKDGHRAIALRGNHDQRLVDLIRTDDTQIQTRFIEHGGLQTVQSYCDYIGNEISNEHLQVARLYWFHEDKIGIDGGCVYGMQLNALIYEAGSYVAREVKIS